jgi:hypothetical protein
LRACAFEKAAVAPSSRLIAGRSTSPTGLRGAWLWRTTCLQSEDSAASRRRIVPFCGASRPPRDATRSLLGNIFGACSSGSGSRRWKEPDSSTHRLGTASCHLRDPSPLPFAKTESPICNRGPRVRILLPPAASQQRTGRLGQTHGAKPTWSSRLWVPRTDSTRRYGALFIGEAAPSDRSLSAGCWRLRKKGSR